jgi:hypothetical protein
MKRGLLWALTTALVVFLIFRLFEKLGVSVTRGTQQWYLTIGGVAVAVFLMFWLAGGSRRGR